MTSLERVSTAEMVAAKAIIGLADVGRWFTKFESSEVLVGEEVRQALQEGSILIIYNHPNTIQGLIDRRTVRPVMKDTEDVKRWGVMVKRNLYNGGLAALELDGITVFPVSTSKYVKDDARRMRENRKVLLEINGFLKRRGSVLELYPEGTRSHPMKQAEPGLAHLAKKAELIIPVGTSFQAGHPRVKVLEPMAARKGVDWCIGRFDGEAARKAWEDLVMTLIAKALPDRNQGFYQSSVELAGRIDLNPNLNEHGFTDEREGAFALTYLAFKEGEFNYGSHVRGPQS